MRRMRGPDGRIHGAACLRRSWGGLKNDRLLLKREGDPTATSTASRREQSVVRVVNGLSSLSPGTVPPPASPSLSVQLPSAPSLSVRLRPLKPSFGNSCTLFQGPPVARGRCAHISYDQLRELCKRKGNCRKDSKAVPQTHLPPMVEVDRKRKVAEGDVTDTSETLTGTRDRAPVDTVEISEKSIGNHEERCHVGDLHLAFVAEKDVAEERAGRPPAPLR